MTARHLFYTGRVQGVGFRFSTKQIASGFDIAGWVKNLPDGRVELWAQSADPDELEAFLEDIQNSSLGSLIKDTQTVSVPADARVIGFSIIR
jgi:acylphosphatase